MRSFRLYYLVRYLPQKDEDREKFWLAKDKLVGRLIEIRADAITQSLDSESYSLRFPRFKNFSGFEIDEKL